jgi:hypothetical protein
VHVLSHVRNENNNNSECKPGESWISEITNIRDYCCDNHSHRLEWVAMLFS